MTTRMLLTLGLSALVLGGTTVGCAANRGVIGSAISRSDDGKQATRAAKALAKHDVIRAVTFAEAAVAAAPDRADHRVLLGQTYLQAGRFVSARDALTDALRLQPDNGRAALNLALAQIATGDWQAARATLTAHAGGIGASDRGLALALAGDPATGVRLLTDAARAPGANAKVRQNLGLALALAGQWPMARAVAAADLSPADVDARLQSWVAFAQPTHASDQVASLLGVTAQADQGQPAMLALATPASTAEAVAAVPVAAPPAAEAAAAPVQLASAKVTSEPQLSASRIVFASRKEVVQALPMPPLRADTRPVKVAVATDPVRAARAAGVAAAMPGRGNWFVQLGAFSDARIAHDAWSRMARRYAAFTDHQPQGTTFQSANGAFYRLSVGGFDRAGADALCRRYRAQGGACFVRREAGDAVAQWLRPSPTRLAAS